MYEETGGKLAMSSTKDKITRDIGPYTDTCGTPEERMYDTERVSDKVILLTWIILWDHIKMYLYFSG